jgi:hypothetical protein
MHGHWDTSVPEDQIVRLADDINRNGYGLLEGCLSERDLEPLRKLVQDSGYDPQGKYASLQDVRNLGGTALAELPQSPQFKTLCQRLYELGTGSKPVQNGFYQVFRCLSGPVGQKNSYIFHYDTYVLTVLVPIIIPEDAPRGDLLMFPNARPIRRAYLHNLLDKALVDNPISRRILKFVAKRRKFGAVAINMRPGNLYFFWGYRTIHANEPCDPANVRATALIHFGDPHQGNRTRAMLRNARRLKAA